MSFGFTHSHRHSLGLSQAQRCKLVLKIGEITPEGICPKCAHELSEEEIKAGWLDNPVDFTTECPKCKTRFIANLIVKHPPLEELEEGDTLEDFDKDDLVVVTVQYLCIPQLFNAMKLLLEEHEQNDFETMFFYEHDRQDLLWNMVRHFGDCANAWEKYLEWLEPETEENNDEDET